jgi:hypothetical protein
MKYEEVNTTCSATMLIFKKYEQKGRRDGFEARDIAPKEERKSRPRTYVPKMERDIALSISIPLLATSIRTEIHAR